MRHTFASRLTALGKSPIFVAQLMGHSSLNILHTYAKSTDEDRRSLIAALDADTQAQITKSESQNQVIQ